MPRSVRIDRGAGLERSCGDWVWTSGPIDGIELLQARFGGRGYSPHRHDTYGVSITDAGVQRFDYRGKAESSLPGQITVLHPDELHDGRAGTDAGFGYRIVYVAPALIGEAVRAITGRPMPLPFVREPVASSAALANTVIAAFGSDLQEPLARDALVVRLAEQLLHADRSVTSGPKQKRVDAAAVARAREFLDAERGATSSRELEGVTGLSRYELARQFRAAYGTSPYRYSVLRRLDRARAALRGGGALAQIAQEAGFADQAHFTRSFTAAFGMPPGRYTRIRTEYVTD